MNPPYSKLGPKFIARFAKLHPEHVPQACLLLAVHHLTTSWFQPLVQFHPVACVPNKRLKFTRPDGQPERNAPAHGSVVLGVGVDPDRFRAAFAPFGHVWSLG